MAAEPVEFPPFEFSATAQHLRELSKDVAAWQPVGHGSSVSAIWLKLKDGSSRLLSVDQRDLQPLFEVFTLSVTSLDELVKLWENWAPPKLADNIPEQFRALFQTRPAKPEAPQDWNGWPFKNWQMKVLRRAEFILEGGEGATIGINPNSQSATLPGDVPPEAAAYCEVAAGLLFSSGEDRLLFAVDWMPMNILVLTDAEEIADFIADGEIMALEDYLEHFR